MGGWTAPTVPDIRTIGIETLPRIGVAAFNIFGSVGGLLPAMRTGGMALLRLPCIAALGPRCGTAPDAWGNRTGGMVTAGRWVGIAPDLCGCTGGTVSSSAPVEWGQWLRPERFGPAAAHRRFLLWGVVALLDSSSCSTV
jgi:hypothetical protein